MIRVGVNPVIFLLNNGSYVIEEEIHQGPYNRLVRWDYCGLAHAMKGGSDNLFTAKARARRP
jgi:pyruvate decarboxylase